MAIISTSYHRTSSAAATIALLLREGQLVRGLLLCGGDGGRRGSHLGLPRVDDVLHATHLSQEILTQLRSPPQLNLAVPHLFSNPIIIDENLG